MGRSSSCRPSRPTGSEPGRWAQTPSDEHPAIAQLKADLAALDAEPLAGASGIQISRRRTDIVDVAVRALFEPFEGSGMALAALGGYGRREMTPGSDIDLL